MSCCNFLGLYERRPTLPDRLETEPDISRIDPGGGGRVGRVAEQSLLTQVALATKQQEETTQDELTTQDQDAIERKAVDSWSTAEVR